MADRQAVLIHSGAVILNGQGLLFVGHSEAGKSTTMNLLKDAAIDAEILCDDRNVIRGYPVVNNGDENKKVVEWRLHGTWSHGDVADVSPNDAPLRAILFLQQAPSNEIVPLTDRKEIWKRLLATLIRPMVTADWWNKEIDVLSGIVAEVPCYIMNFDRSGTIIPQIEALTEIS
ncbi:hypothetical protein CCP3SC1_1300009 [Gammaproteobacteria bacterium]